MGLGHTLTTGRTIWVKVNMDLVFRETLPSDIEGLFSVRARTRENAFSKEMLASIGITPESIAEQMATRSSINMWDGSTRGLDASSALDYVKSLRVQTNLLKKATMVSIYQAVSSAFSHSIND